MLDRLRDRVPAPSPYAFWNPLDRIELPLLRLVRRVRFGGAANDATEVISKTGEHGIVWYAVAASAAAFDRPRRGRWLAAGASVAAVYGANTALKFVARRHRPPLAEIGTETALSFPSAHAATSFAAAEVFGALAPGMRPPLRVAAAGVTSSRLHFLVHYPSDLVAGAALGHFAGRTIGARYFASVPMSASKTGA